MSFHALAASQPPGWTLTQLRVLAGIACLCAAVAFGSLPLVSPRTGRRLGLWGRVAVAAVPALAGAAYALAATARRGEDEATGLQLGILALLALAILRVVFARWLRRAGKVMEAGGTVSLAGWQVAVFLVALVVVTGCLAIVLSWLPTVWQ